MKCPECGKELEFVHVYSQCYERGELKDDTIVGYYDIEVLDTQYIECPFCLASLAGVVKNNNEI